MNQMMEFLVFYLNAINIHDKYITRDNYVISMYISYVHWDDLVLFNNIN